MKATGTTSAGFAENGSLTMRLIDANDLKKKAYAFPCATGVEYAVPLRAINEAPTIDYEPVRHAEWIWADMGTMGFPNWEGMCSNCEYIIGDRMNTKHSTTYCPGCGAKMNMYGDEAREG